MIITYTAVDGYSISGTSTGAWLMSDTAATMITDRVGNSPLKNLTVNGSITTSAVASNSSTLAASGFSASNYYSRAYDSAFDPGTSGLSAKIWFKGTASTQSPLKTQILFMRGDNLGLQIYYLIINIDGTISAVCDDNSTARTATSTTTYVDGLWHCAVMVFDGTDLDLYIDGAFVKNATGAALNSLSNATATLTIGLAAWSNSPFEGSLAGLEIEVATQWTAQQIKSKYESERVLFEQLETFSIVGQSLTYEESLLSASIGNAISENFSESLNGTRTGLTWYRKKEMACTTIPFARSSLPSAYKFLKSTNNVTFTFDERGTSSSSDNPITVYKTSANEQLQYNNPYYQFSFSVRES